MFYQLEAVHLGDLLRLLVRPGVKVIHSLGFSRAVKNAPDPTEVSSSTRHRPLAPDNPISGGLSGKGEKKTLPGALASVSELICVAARYPRPGFRILTVFPFDWQREEARALKRSFPIS